MSSAKLEAFRELIAASPNEDWEKLAKLAGYTDPKGAVERVKRADAKAEQKAIEEEEERRQGVTPDRALATRTLRTLARSGTDQSRVQAARALMEASPQPTSGRDQFLVVFRGRQSDQHQNLAADIDPELLAAAIAHVREQRELAHEEQLTAYAQKHAIDAEDMAMAWELFSDHGAKAAALRVYLQREQTAEAAE